MVPRKQHKENSRRNLGVNQETDQSEHDKATDQKVPLRHEDEMEEQGYKIGGQGEACKIREDHKIWLIDEQLDELLRKHRA